MGNGTRSGRSSSDKPLTGLNHELRIALDAAQPYLETTITIQNKNRNDVRFSHWTTALLSPGGTGQLTADTELIVPAERFVPDERDFNRWMAGLAGPTRTSPLRLVRNWQSIGDLMTTPLQKGYYAAYTRQGDEAVIRTFDRDKTPGLDIWCWGYPPTEAHQRLFTAAPPNLGYVEFWNGTAKDFSDEARTVLRPGQVIAWSERTYTVSGLSKEPDVRAALERRLEASSE